VVSAGCRSRPPGTAVRVSALDKGGPDDPRRAAAAAAAAAAGAALRLRARKLGLKGGQLLGQHERGREHLGRGLAGAREAAAVAGEVLGEPLLQRVLGGRAGMGGGGFGRWPIC
jgi:hypothetical protein